MSENVPETERDENERPNTEARVEDVEPFEDDD